MKFISKQVHVRKIVQHIALKTRMWTLVGMLLVEKKDFSS